MITREDLQEAIAECQGVRNPNVKTCIELAAFLVIQDHLEDEELIATGYSGSEPRTVSAVSDSEFSKAIDGKPETDVLLILDDAMNSVKYFNPKLYADIIRRLSDT